MKGFSFSSREGVKGVDTHGLTPVAIAKEVSFILRAACPQTPCKDGIHPRSYEHGPLPWFDS